METLTPNQDELTELSMQMIQMIDEQNLVPSSNVTPTVATNANSEQSNEQMNQEQSNQSKSEIEIINKENTSSSMDIDMDKKPQQESLSESTPKQAPIKRNVAVKNSQANMTQRIAQVKQSLSQTSFNSEHVILDDENDDILNAKPSTPQQTVPPQPPAPNQQLHFARKSTSVVSQILNQSNIKPTALAPNKNTVNGAPTHRQQQMTQVQANQHSKTSIGTSTSQRTTSITPTTNSTLNSILNSSSITHTQPLTPNAASQNVKQLKHKIVSCKPFYQTKATECYPSVKHVGTQLDLDDIKPSHTVVPVPVPINVPTPMCMYQAPMPVPLIIPIPIPVPVFIPTTKRTFDRVQRRITKLRKKLPSDPSEFALLLYAEKLAREEGLPGFSDSSDGEDEPEPEPREKRKQKVEPLKDDLLTQVFALDDSESNFKWMYGVKTFNQWLTTKIADDQTLKLPNDLLKLKNNELNVLLSEFIFNIRKPKGETYAPESVYYLCLGIQHFLQENGRIENIFLDTQYEQFQEAFNEIALKYQIRMNADGQIMSRIEEEILWESKQLGAHSPFVLLNTILYFNTKYFFLDKVESHLQLSFTNVKKHSKRNIGPNGEEYGKTAYLRYYPDFQGIEQVIYEQGENYDNPLRCPVKLYEFYLSKW